MKTRISILYLSDTYDFTFSDGLISHVIKKDDSSEVTEMLYEQCPEGVKKKLNKEIEEQESEE